jgi:hypothetical protein
LPICARVCVCVCLCCGMGFALCSQAQTGRRGQGGAYVYAEEPVLVVVV